MMTALWIDGTDEHGNEYSVRWENVTDERADDVLAYVERVLGRPDTVA